LEADFSSSLANEFSSGCVDSSILVEVVDEEFPINGELSHTVDQGGNIVSKAVLASRDADDLSRLVGDLSIHVNDEDRQDPIDVILDPGDAEGVDEFVHIDLKAGIPTSLADHCAGAVGDSPIGVNVEGVGGASNVVGSH